MLIIDYRLHLISPWNNGVTICAKLVLVRKEALSGAKYHATSRLR